MRQKEQKFLILSNISEYNEKIIIGILFIKNSKVEVYFDKTRMDFLKNILSSTKYIQIKYFYDFLNKEDINLSDIKNISTSNGLIEVQNRNSINCSCLDDMKELFFK